MATYLRPAVLRPAVIVVNLIACLVTLTAQHELIGFADVSFDFAWMLVFFLPFLIIGSLSAPQPNKTFHYGTIDEFQLE